MTTDDENNIMIIFEQVATPNDNIDTLQTFFQSTIKAIFIKSDFNDFLKYIERKIIYFCDSNEEKREIFISQMMLLIGVILKNNNSEYKFIYTYILNVLTFQLNYDEKYKNTIAITNENFSLTQTVVKGLDRLTNKTNDLISQSITIIGIFVAIILTIYGGLSIITSLDSLLNQTLIRLVGVITVVGQILFNILFLVMFLLSRIAEKPIHTVCSQFDESDFAKTESKVSDELFGEKIKYLNENKRFISIDLSDPKNQHCLYCKRNEECLGITKLFSKFPYAVIINTLFIIIEFFLIVVYICRFALYNHLINHEIWFLVTTVIFSIAFIGLIIYMLFKNYRCDKALSKEEIFKERKEFIKNHYRKSTITIAAVIIVYCVIAFSFFINAPDGLQLYL